MVLSLLPRTAALKQVKEPGRQVTSGLLFRPAKLQADSQVQSLASDLALG